MRTLAARRRRNERGSDPEFRSLLARTIEDVERHLTRLPTVVQGEAQRVRQMVQTETDQILDLSARTLSTIHARSAQGTRVLPPQAAAAPVPEAPEPEGLKGLARKFTQRSKRNADLRGKGEAKGWEMKTLLAAAENSEGRGHFRRQRRGDGRAGDGAGRHGGGSRSHRPGRHAPAATNGSAIWRATAPSSREIWRAPSTMKPSTASPRFIARIAFP